jgi:hypothetical protein
MTDEKETHRETMWAEMKPDLYGGKNCDKLVPQWSCYAEGDKDGEDGLTALELAARTFPPGTKVVVSEPLCPDCGQVRCPKFPTPARGAIYAGPCECGFDWDAWVESQYS